MKKILFILMGGALAFSISSCKHENFDERCSREAKEYTLKQCPQRIDKGITLDSMAYHKVGEGDNASDRTFTYYYTFSDIQDSMLNKLLKEYPDTVRKRFDEFKAAMLQGLTNSVQLKPYKDKGFNFEYIYFSASRNKTPQKDSPILQFKFTKADYKH